MGVGVGVKVILGVLVGVDVIDGVAVGVFVGVGDAEGERGVGFAAGALDEGQNGEGLDGVGVVGGLRAAGRRTAKEPGDGEGERQITATRSAS